MLKNPEHFETNGHNLEKLRITNLNENDAVNDRTLLKHTYGFDQKKTSLYANNQKNTVTKQNISKTDNEKIVARASVATFNSGSMRTTTSNGSRAKRNLYFKDPLDSSNRKAANSKIEKWELDGTIT